MAWIENDDGAVLLVQQTVGQKLWTLPGGKVKRNESLERALKREVREETGLRVAGIRYRQMYDRPKRGAITVLFAVSVKRTPSRPIFLLQKSPILVSSIACLQTPRHRLNSFGRQNIRA
jgi:ADP-ribose pyrophosphatase YjhB (NUDIX family)